MDTIAGVFDGEAVILENQLKIELREIKRARIELEPYLLFPIELEQVNEEMETSEGVIIYPHTVERVVAEAKLVTGEKRPTRILHYIPYGGSVVTRKTDLLHPHTVKILGYRTLIIEKRDGREFIVTFDGNCHDCPQGVTTLVYGQDKTELKEFYDRPSILIDILKKAGIEVYAK